MYVHVYVFNAYFIVVFLLFKGVHKHKPVGAESQWQRPEISSNLAEDLSLDDPIDMNLLPQQKEKRSKLWKEAHSKNEREEGSIMAKYSKP